jgi:hypothetical protein
MSELKLSANVIKRLAEDFYAADGFLRAFDSVFVDTYGRMGLEARALATTQDIPPIFVIAPGLFEGDEDNDSGDCQQYNTPHSNLRLIANEPVGHVQFEINYLIEVPQQTKKFWVKCSRSNEVMPKIQLLGEYESITSVHELAEAILYDLFVIQIDTSALKR